MFRACGPTRTKLIKFKRQHSGLDILPIGAFVFVGSDPALYLLMHVNRSVGSNLLSLGVYFVVASMTMLARVNPAAAAEICGDLFSVRVVARSLAPSQTLNRVDSGPVATQCGGTCRYESALSHLQAQFHQTFSSDFANLKRMSRTIDYVLDDAAAKRTKSIPIGTHGLVEILDPPQVGEASTSFWSTLFKLETVGALVPADKFKFTKEFEHDMRSWAKEVGVQNADGRPVQTVEILGLKAGLILSDLVEAIEKGGPASSLVRQARVEIDQLFASAYKGLQAGVDAKSFTDKFLRGVKSVTLRPISPWSPKQVGGGRGDIEAMVRRQVDAGRDVALYFMQNDRLINEKTGVAQLKRPLKDELRFLKAHKAEYKEAGHAVVIDGYTLAPNGQIEWLLIKDSHGASVYDRGYIHMHIDYFRAYVYSASALGA